MSRGGPRLHWVAPFLLLAVAACTTTPAARSGSPEPRDPGSRAADLVAHADDLARGGQGRPAQAAYERVLREHPGTPAGASALYGLGRLHADPTGGLRNYRAAQRVFARLLAEYPESRWEAEARTWQAVLGELLARETEAARLKEDAARLRDETLRLKTQIERLRRTDLELERRR